MNDQILNQVLGVVIIAIYAMTVGFYLDRFFADKPDAWSILQIILVGIAYSIAKQHLKFHPDAWIIFAPLIFNMQPTLPVRLRRFFTFIH
jgi:hypothetical protein